MFNAGRVTINLAGNYTMANKLLGVVANPKLIEEAGQQIFDYMQEAFVVNEPPKIQSHSGQ